MRTFVAIEISRQFRREIAGIITSMKNGMHLRKHDIKWVSPDNIHLTLKFLGEVKDREITDVCKAVADAAVQSEPFELQPDEIGTFGRPARVLWIGIMDNPLLMQLQETIEQNLANLGFKPENRKYCPHLTVARMKNNHAGHEIQNYVSGMEKAEFSIFDVNSVSVFKSDLTSDGPVYTLMNKVELG